MAEESWPWPGTTVGDAGPYSADDWDNMWETLYGSGVSPYNDRGVIRNWLNELEVTDGGANQADVDTGAALVHGKFYRNTAVVNVTVPSSVGAWREDLICLQSSWVAQTIRIYRHANPADGVSYPAPTQTDAVTWEIPLAAVRIDNAGVITQITDLRDYISDLMQPKEISSPPHPDIPTGASWGVPGMHVGCQRGNPGAVAGFELKIPQDFLDILEAYVVVMADPNTSLDWTFSTAGGSCEENVLTWTDSVTEDGHALVANIFECLDVTAAFDNVNIKAGDIVGCDLTIDVLNPVSTLYVYMLVFRYL